MSKLTQAQRAAVREACDAYSPNDADASADVRHHIQTERNSFFAGFLAGLRYQDGVSKGLERALEQIERNWRAPREIARAALLAAREVRSEDG